MPTLLQSLQKHDLGHLQIIAEGWDLALQAPDVRQGRKTLAAAMRKAASLPWPSWSKTSIRKPNPLCLI